MRRHQFLEADVHASDKSDVCWHFEFQHAFGQIGLVDGLMRRDSVICDELDYEALKYILENHRQINRPIFSTDVIESSEAAKKNYIKILKLVKHYKPDVFAVDDIANSDILRKRQEVPVTLI